MIELELHAVNKVKLTLFVSPKLLEDHKLLCNNDYCHMSLSNI